MDALELAGARCRLVEDGKLPPETAGFLLMGGVDVDPGLYKEKRGPHTDKPHKARDAQESALLNLALEADLPVLAVCRGHQLLNVVLGGTLLQNVPDDGHKWTPEGDSAWHEIALEAGSHVADAFGGVDTLRVNSRHHQGITEDRLAPALQATAFSHDRYVEAVQHRELRWVTGVQWHPERPEMREDSKPLFGAFVAACAGDGQGGGQSGQREPRGSSRTKMGTGDMN
jgi:gamma-glutamyl-gamma-aminobutyrate hydrolase PuuD